MVETNNGDPAVNVVCVSLLYCVHLLFFCQSENEDVMMSDAVNGDPAVNVVCVSLLYCVHPHFIFARMKKGIRSCMIKTMMMQRYW